MWYKLTNKDAQKWILISSKAQCPAERSPTMNLLGAVHMGWADLFLPHDTVALKFG